MIYVFVAITAILAAFFAAHFPVVAIVVALCIFAGLRKQNTVFLPAAFAAIGAFAGFWLYKYYTDFCSLFGKSLPAATFRLQDVLTFSLASGSALWARYGLLCGAAAGFMLAAGAGSLHSRRHDARHVHGLPVAQNAAKGTRRWAGDADLAHVAEFGPPREGRFGGGTLIGRLQGRIVRLYPDKCKPPLPQHTCAVAGTGAGKTFSFVIPNAICAALEGESIVMTDPKGELACTLAPWLRQKGYHVYVFNLAFPQHSSFWNPAAEARDDEEITAFATAIIQNAAKDKSGYFVMKEIQLLKALIYLLKADFPPSQAHLRSALSLLSWPVEVLDERFNKSYKSGKLSQEGFEEWRGAVAENYQNAVSGLSAKLGIVRSADIAKLLSKQEIDMTKIGKEKAALFCILPVGAGHLKPILATFYYFFFRRLYALAADCGGKLPNPTRFLLDEFANIGQIPGFVEVISTARSLGIKIQFVLQGLKQLQDVYGTAESEAILSNCPIQAFLGGDDLTTTKYFSSRLGEAAVYGISERKDISLPWRRWTGDVRMTENVTKRSLMTPEELAGMDPMAGIALVRWALPVYFRKLGWTELKQAKDIQALSAKSLSEVMPARAADEKLDIPEPPIGADGSDADLAAAEELF